MEQWIANPSSVTVVGLLLVAIATGAKGIWEFESTVKKRIDELLANHQRERDNYEQQIKDIRAGNEERLNEVRKDRDEWKEIALAATDIGKRVASVAERRLT